MALLDEIQRIARDRGATLGERGGVHTFRLLVAERKVFLSRRRLEYIAWFRVHEDAREVRFSEMLKESGSGLSGVGDDMAPGFGFKTEVYKTGMGGRDGTIEEQSRLFGKTYAYSFDFRAIQEEIAGAARAAGYEFSYRITPLGI